jgi:hypothetical protein
MALRPFVTEEELAKLPDVLRAEYAKDEKAGRYLLQVTPSNGWALEDVTGLKETLSDRMARHKDAAAKLAAYGDITPEQARHAVEQLGKLGDLTDKEKIDSRLKAEREQLASKYEAELKKREAESSTLLKEVERVLVDSEVARILAKPEVRGSFPLLIGPIRSQVRVERGEGGQFRVVVLDKNGNPAISRKANSNGPMDLEEHVLSLKEHADFQRAFEAQGSTGSGASGTGSRNGTTNVVDPKLPAVERLKLLRAKQGS